MPLVVPGLQSKDGSSSEDWMGKLMGKKLGDTHDEVVCFWPFFPAHLFDFFLPPFLYHHQLSHANTTNTTQTFAKADLPKEHRVLKPDSMSTMDHKPERLNVHVDEEGTVKKVTHG
ncbi:hypothetical protein IAQ61_006125 [Plenodomus lingam]|uniref:uncharacterized protein n=1 Tax=Leptosphaeria maculans TaxID=5022 RepID=UPI003317DE37|nr:hypothetical protein IAQ61_006125 [Plenodomus lingam]